jgi:DNA-binding CsgD family transcriptional regulator
LVSAAVNIQIAILRLVGRGIGNAEIAEKAHLSPFTVRSHLKSLYRKLKLASRPEAVAYAIRHHMT